MHAAEAEPAKKVAVVPFTVYAEKDLTFLQKGIVDMLASRLSEAGEVSVIGRKATQEALEGVEGPLSPEKAGAVGRTLGADYVLFGSLTVFGESVSVDATMIEVDGGKPPLTFYTQSQSLGEVIPAIDRFAGKITAEVFGRTEATPAPSPPPATKSNAAAAPPAGMATQAHPEKLIEGGFAAEPETRRVGEGGVALANAWKSRGFRDPIMGIDLGDVDNDGKTETVIAFEHKLLVYRFENQRFFQTAEIEVPGLRTVVGVDVGDIKKNGMPEIFVSALNVQRTGVDSIVFEFDGKNYRTIEENAPYYFRVAKDPVLGSRLFGQRQSLGKDAFSRPIFQLIWVEGAYQEHNQVIAAGKANALGFTVGHPTSPHEELFLAFSEGDYLQILEPSGAEVWKSVDKLGGSTMYLKLNVEEKGSAERVDYLPMRIRAADLNGDGRSEVVVADNNEMANRRLQTLRYFSKTQFVLFSWDGIGLAPIWRTRELSGHIRDLAIGDFDGDGIDELVGALIVKEGRIVGTKANCSIISYDILRYNEGSKKE